MEGGCRAYLVGAEHVLVEDLHCDLVNEGVRDPGAVMAVRHLTELVRADLVHGDLVRLGVVLDGNLSGHAAHSGNTSPVARLDEEADIGIHEADFHSDVFAIGEYRATVGTTALNETEDVIPPANARAR